MKVPNARRAVVEKQKVKEYLLNPAHPDGAGKAAFFQLHGFSADRWQELAVALIRHGQSCLVVSNVESVFGSRYTVVGRLDTPDGRNPNVMSVWMIERGKRTPRLITAYPARKAGKT